MTTTINPNGTKIHTFTNKAPDLKTMQKLVGGYIQIVTPQDASMEIVMDEEGKLKEKPANIKATELWLGDNEKDWHDILVGDIVVCKDKARLK